MTAVRRWTGLEARALRVALRLSVRAFAEHLGVAVRTVSKWEAGSVATVPRPDSQAILDTALIRADEHARRRFALLTRDPGAAPDAVGPDEPDRSTRPTPPRGPRRTGPVEHIDELLAHLQEQWHVLVRADNLLGPRFALASVLDQIAVIEEFLPITAGEDRVELVRLAATYAESAAWLHEDAGQAPLAARWVGRAMEWAHEAGDHQLLAWTLFRRSQQAAGDRDAQRTLSLACAAGRNADRLPAPMRAAIAQQEAHGHAIAGDEAMTHHTLDHALQWAAPDTAGDARAGHGSFCTDAYLELQRANCWLTLGRPRQAIELFRAVIPALPAVYRRDRGAACGSLAHAYASTGDPEAAAQFGREALATARSSGSVRTEHVVTQVGRHLASHRHLPTVALLLHELDPSA